MGKSKIIVLLMLGLLAARESLSSIHDKSRVGVYYNYGFAPKASQLLDSQNKVNLSSFHYSGFQVEVPHNQYLAYGFSFDMLLVRSPNWARDNMGTSMVNSRVMAMALSGLLKPQIPIPVPWGDLLGFLALEVGFGGTPALTMGAYNLSRREYDNSANVPSAFPILLNTAIQAGMEYYFSELIGVQLGVGYRALWFIHPLTERKNPEPGLPYTPESVLIYDVSALFASASIKLAF